MSVFECFNFQQILLNIWSTQNANGSTIPIIAFADDYKLLYAIGNVAGPSPTPGTPAPGEAFVTVYFRVNNLFNVGVCNVELELLKPCGDRAIDPSVVGAEGVPVSEVVKDDSLQLVRTGQTIIVDLNDLASIERLNPSIVVMSCP